MVLTSLSSSFRWDKSTLSTLYLSIIAHDASILSLRSLRGEHLLLLIEMRTKTEQVVRELYPSIEKGQLRFFVHYQPSYCASSSLYFLRRDRLD